MFLEYLKKKFWIIIKLKCKINLKYFKYPQTFFNAKLSIFAYKDVPKTNLSNSLVQITLYTEIKISLAGKHFCSKLSF